MQRMEVARKNRGHGRGKRDGGDGIGAEDGGGSGISKGALLLMVDMTIGEKRLPVLFNLLYGFFLLLCINISLRNFYGLDHFWLRNRNFYHLGLFGVNFNSHG
ncbi:hypothetical protein NE237_029356 [Protea cynaroides]|uniref:Transmembrane protein n=1 Tax=Protea cynaroides TaxID=273540 RepID=A0A9Q0GVM6_9MAGN|nr:hypothetical protein NE237_029356 [Protea cynaroides]